LEFVHSKSHPNYEKYFEKSLEGKTMPQEASEIKKLIGQMTSWLPDNRPSASTVSDKLKKILSSSNK